MAFLACTQWKLHCRHCENSEDIPSVLMIEAGQCFFLFSKFRSSHKTQNDCHKRLAKGQLTINLMFCDCCSTCHTSDWVQQSLWIDLSEKSPIIHFSVPRLVRTPISLKYQKRKFGYYCLDILCATNSLALSLNSGSVFEFEPTGPEKTCNYTEGQSRNRNGILKILGTTERFHPIIIIT